MSDKSLSISMFIDWIKSVLNCWMLGVCYKVRVVLFPSHLCSTGVWHAILGCGVRVLCPPCCGWHASWHSTCMHASTPHHPTSNSSSTPAWQRTQSIMPASHGRPWSSPVTCTLFPSPLTQHPYTQKKPLPLAPRPPSEYLPRKSMDSAQHAFCDD